MKAVVMAGGEGTRLRPLTSNQPKPMVPIVGKPCIEHIVELLRGHGMDEVVVTLAFMPQAIRSYFGDGESLGVSIEYSVEELPLGTAGSVRLASEKLDDTFLVISGDALCDVDLGALVDRHKETGAAVTIGLKSVDNPLEFGIVVTDDDGKVERFLEKPSWGQVFSDTINTGIYVLEPEVLTHIPTDGPYDFSKELFPLLLEMGRPIYGHVMEGYWQDIGNLDQYRQANFDALDESVRLEHRGRAAARQRLDRRGDRHPRRRGDRGPGVHRQPLPDHARRLDRPVHRALERRHAARARADDALRDRRGHARRPQRADRGRDHRPRVRHPRPRADPGGRGDRRRGHDRLRVEHRAARPDLPVQGGRDRLAGLREPDLGDARVVAPVRQGRRLRPRQRRPHARDGRAPRDRARHGAQARRARRREPRLGAGLPDDQAGDDLGPERVRRRRRRPARLAAGGEPARPEDAGLRRRRARRLEPSRPRGRLHPHLRAARDPAHVRAAEGDREELHAPGAPARRRRRRRLGLVPGPRPRELRAGPARVARRGGDPRAPLPDRRRLRLLGGVVRAPARRRPARGRGDLGARLLRRGAGRARVAGAGDRAHEAARDGDRRRPRRRLRPVGRAALPRRRPGPRGSGRPDAPALRPPARRPRRRRARSPSRSR